MENWKFALSSIMGHKLRSFLTMLGIIIGVASVVVIMALGDGIKQSFTKAMSKERQYINLFYESEPEEDAGEAFGAFFGGGYKAEAPSPDENWLKEVITRVDGADNYYLTNNTTAAVEFRNKKADSVNITGISETYFDVRNYDILAGRRFTKEDYRQFARIIMLDTQLAVKLFGSNEEALNKVVSVGEKTYRVVGVYKDPNAGTAMYGMASDGNAIMVLNQVVAEFGIPENAQSIIIYASDPLRVDEIGHEAALTLTQVAGLREGRYSIFDMSNYMAELNAEIAMVTIVIGSIAGISLLVGGIGVMNIMLVSVTERTREIGLRKALGATRGKILTQFLIEAVVLTVLGGGIGLSLAYGLTTLIGQINPKLTFSISWTASLGSLLFSAFIGILFGLLPANRASKLDPIEALRYE